MCNLKLFFALLFLTCSSNLFSQGNDWKLIKNENGIKIYSRTDTSKSALKELKVITELQTSLSAFITVFSDKASYTKWVYRCSASELLKKVSENETYHYQITEMPWPVQNRDIIIHSWISQNPQTQVVTVICKGEPNYIPKKKDYIRISSYNVVWKLTPKPNNIVQLEYTMAVNPGGSLPSWLINMTLADGPINTIKNLRAILPQYQNVKLSYIKN
jgi:hypothetical protein